MMGLLWKNCFYKNIEEFRKSLKVLKGQLDINRMNHKLVDHVARLAQEFSAFLKDSSNFISGLMSEVSQLSYFISLLKMKIDIVSLKRELKKRKTILTASISYY